MWVWMRLHHERVNVGRWNKLKVAGIYAIGALLLAFGIAVLGGR